MYRTSSFDKYLSEKLHRPNFAQAYLLELVNSQENRLDIDDALRETINIIGITEFSKLIGENKSNVSNFVKGNRKLKQETLNKYLIPFRLKAKLKLEAA